MRNYMELLSRVYHLGAEHTDRTGVGTIRTFGEVLKFDLADGFPVLAVRKTPWRSAIGEMIAFVRGANTVEEFEELGCKFWKANAEGWDSQLADGNNLGRIYGQQARHWNTGAGTFDQLASVYSQIKTNPDSRRLLVTHWRPDEFGLMALPPCHVQYQFMVDKEAKEMHLKFDMRSTDMVLGAPNNIVGYAFLLWITAKRFGYTPRRLIMTMGDCHIYKDHLEGVKEMMSRPWDFAKPNLMQIADPEHNPDHNELDYICSLHPDMFVMQNYEPLEAIKFNMAV